MTHVEKPGQDWTHEDVHVAFFLCGAFATFGPDADLRPEGIDFVLHGSKTAADCPRCQTLLPSAATRQLERVR